MVLKNVTLKSKHVTYCISLKECSFSFTALYFVSKIKTYFGKIDTVKKSR